MLTRRALLFGAPRPNSGEDALDLRYSEDGVAAVADGLIAGLIGVVLVGAAALNSGTFHNKSWIARIERSA